MSVNLSMTHDGDLALLIIRTVDLNILGLGSTDFLKVPMPLSFYKMGRNTWVSFCSVSLGAKEFSTEPMETLLRKALLETHKKLMRTLFCSLKAILGWKVSI